VKEGVLCSTDNGLKKDGCVSSLTLHSGFYSGIYERQSLVISGGMPRLVVG